MDNTLLPRKKKCECNIRGVFSMWRAKKDYGLLIHPDDYVKYLRL